MSYSTKYLPINKNFITVRLDTPLTEVITQLNEACQKNINQTIDNDKQVSSSANCKYLG